MEPLLTIGIFNYNKGSLIHYAINSVINSTFKNWLCYIIDDGSTDGYDNAILNLIKYDSRFTFIKKPNTGISDSRNFFLHLVNTKYLTFLDGDDEYINDYLDRGVKYLESHKECDLYFNIPIGYSEDGHGLLQVCITDEPTYINLFDKKFILHCSSIYRSLIAKQYQFRNCLSEDVVFNIEYLYPNRKFYYSKEESSILYNASSNTYHLSCDKSMRSKCKVNEREFDLSQLYVHPSKINLERIVYENTIKSGS